VTVIHVMRPIRICVVAAVAALAIPACWDAEDEADLPPAHKVESSGCSPVTHEGQERPDLIIAASAPLQGKFIDHGVQIVQALKLVLDQRDWRAGEYGVGLQACDETTPRSDESDPAKCRRNARSFAENRSVIAVAGPWSSTCALAMLPILNRAPAGPLAAISGSTTYLGLTRPGPAVGATEPERFFPTGRRSFVRVIPADDVQGAAGALFAKGEGARSVFVLNDDEPYGFGVAEAFRLAAARTGLRVAGTARWNPTARDYRALARRIAGKGAEAVYLGGYVSGNGIRLIMDLRRTLGEEVLIIGPDGFATPDLIVERAGPHAEGFAWTIPVVPNDELPAAGRELADDFEERFASRPCCFSVPAAQTASMLLDAIADSGGGRARVGRDLLGARVEDGYLGDFEIDRYGDTTLNTIAVYRIVDGRLRFQTAITPPAELLARR
jgi:branched-chain amino acid transport system substrate-binding protein